MCWSSMAPKLLIFGRGFLAGRLAEYFQERAVLCPADIADPVQVGEAVKSEHPTWIINAAGKTDTAALEDPAHQAAGYRANVQGPALLALAAKRAGCRLLHFSTCMFFDGSGPDGQGIREEQVPEPQGFYSWTKAWAEGELLPLMQETVLVARIESPFSYRDHPKNLLSKLRRFDRIVDEPASRTCVEDLLPALHQLMGQGATGLYNLTNPDSISLYGMAESMKEAGLIPADKPIARLSRVEFATERQGAPIPFPIMSSAKAERAGVRMRPVQEAVQDAVKRFEHAG